MIQSRYSPVLGLPVNKLLCRQSLIGYKPFAFNHLWSPQRFCRSKAVLANDRASQKKRDSLAARHEIANGADTDKRLRAFKHFLQSTDKTNSDEKHSVRKHQRRLIESTKDLRSKFRSSITRLQARENLYTIPNILTYSRLIAAPVIGYLVLHEQHSWAVTLFFYAGVTDLVDGWIARRWKLQTVVGSVVDPMADKILMTVLVGCLAAKGLLPLWLATLILGRDISLGLAAIYYRWASLAPPKTFSRYWDFSLPSASVHPTTMSKINTLLQLILIGTTTAMPLLNTITFPTTTNIALLDQFIVGMASLQDCMQAMQYLVAVTTVWSGASYVWIRNAVRILGSDEALKKRQGRRGRALIGLSFAAFVTLSFSLSGT